MIAWEASPLATILSEAVWSFKVGLAKPDPEVYRLACTRLGVKAEETAFVGDGGSGELVGAQQVGIVAFQALWFLRRWPRFQASPAAPCALRVPSEVADAIRCST